MALTICPRLNAVPYPIAHRAYYLLSGIQPKMILNCGCPNEETTLEDIGRTLKKRVQALKTEFFDADQGRIDYQSLRTNSAYQDYQKITEALNDFDLGSLPTHAEKLAFWLNLYNTLLVDAVIAFDIQNSVQEVKAFFARIAYGVGGYRFSADDIEHGILRANVGHPAIPGKQFAKNDPRTSFALKEFDPRIHFALNCASRSCPPINVYLGENIDQQLDLATRNFINGGEFQVDVQNLTVTMSMIFRWYAPDFGGSALNQIGRGDFTNILKWAGHYLNESSARTRLLENPKAFKVQFTDYDWSLNIV